MRALVLVAALAAGPAVAGGYGGPIVMPPTCGALAAAGQMAHGVVCVDGDRMVTVTQAPSGQAQGRWGRFILRLLSERERVEYVDGRRCPYPERPSDSAFSGGAGYIIKNDVRRQIGCAF